MSLFSAASDPSLTRRAVLGTAARDLGVASAYFILAILSTRLQFAGLKVSPLCVPCGFGLAVTLRYGYGAITGIFIGAFCAATFTYASAENPDLLSVRGLSHWLSTNPTQLFLIATKTLGAITEVVLGTFLIRILHGRRDIFNSIKGVINFCLAVLLACAIGSTISTGIHAASDTITTGKIISIWLVRWLGHTAGILSLTPLLTIWWPPIGVAPRPFDPKPTVLLGAALLLGLTGLSHLALNYWGTPYVLFPILLLTTFKFGPRAATLGIVIVTVSAVIATVKGNGLFVRTEPLESMILLQSFISVISMTVLFLDAALCERRTAFSEARAAVDRFQRLFESVPIGVIALDARVRILHANEQVERMFGYDRAELIGLSVESLLPAISAMNARFREHATEAPQLRPVDFERDLFGRRADGSEFPVEISLAPCRDRESSLTLLSVVDITERKEAERHHQNLLRRMWQAIDGERLRLAHELHDQTGQNVTSVMLELQRIESELNERGRNRLHRLRSQLDDMAQSLHRIAWELRPASIDELGLRSVLETYVADWSDRSGIQGDFHCRDEKIDDLSDDVRTIIYRVMQEALTNVAKHATGATSASVIIDGDHRMLRLTIEDDGAGFDRSRVTTKSPEGLGLAGMRERLSAVRGKLEIESTPGRGTTLFVRIPRDCDLES